MSHCQTCNLGDSHPLVLSLYWAQPGKEEGGRREREGGGMGREENREERRKKEKRCKVEEGRREGGVENGEGGGRERNGYISPVCMCGYKCPLCIGPHCSLLPSHLTLEQ